MALRSLSLVCTADDLLRFDAAFCVTLRDILMGFSRFFQIYFLMELFEEFA
jgi:hypothetical protein